MSVYFLGGAWASRGCWSSGATGMLFIIWDSFKLLINDLYMTCMSLLGSPGIRGTNRASRTKGSAGECLFCYNESNWLIKEIIGDWITGSYVISHRYLHTNMCILKRPWQTQTIYYLIIIYIIVFTCFCTRGCQAGKVYLVPKENL